jgi:hypothetical protein
MAFAERTGGIPFKRSGTRNANTLIGMITAANQGLGERKSRICLEHSREDINPQDTQLVANMKRHGDC